MISVTVNGRALEGREGETILSLADRFGIAIPTLCAERRLDAFDSCGVCSVEVEGAGVVRACSTPIKDKMVVTTASPAAEETHRSALELLLSYHFGDCVGPCQLACPGHTDCQGYVSLAANGLFLEGLELLYEKLPFPAAFGRICPSPCEDACRRQIAEEPVQIRHMKRFLGDRGFPYIPACKPDTGFRVAVVGGGPAGLSAAYFLRRRGHRAVVFDAMPKMGGMLRYGIPDFRLPQEILDRELDVLKEMGIEFRNGVRLGANLTLDELERDYDAIFLGLGAWDSRSLSVPHEDHPAVQQGIEFLRRLNCGEAVSLPERVVVVGGGNTAIDAARCARRLGAEVTLVYRRGRDEMPAAEREVVEAEEEEVAFRFLTQPVEFVVEGEELAGIRCLEMRLGEPDASGRARPVPIPGSQFVVPADAAILAVGQSFEPSVLADSGIRVDDQRRIVVDPETGRTDREKVFAGGDAASGPGIAIEAVAAGRRAAEAIDRLLSGEPIGPPLTYAHEKHDVTRSDLGEVQEARRVPTPMRPPEKRVRDFEEYETDFTDDQAREEGRRCLACGCARGFDCELRDHSAAVKAAQESYAGELERKRGDGRHPFIVRDPGKCVACGRCLRVCGEVCGIHAIDFAGRGIQVEVQAPFDRPWQESVCISCGACVDACPTGALADRVNLRKQVPVLATQTRTICSLCGLACSVHVMSFNGHYLGTVPAEEDGILCAKGRYGWQAWWAGARLTTPLVREGEKLVPASWEEAFERVRDRMPRTRDRVAVVAGGLLTNEEGYLLARLAHAVLGTRALAIEAFPAPPVERAPVRLFAAADSLAQADLVVLVGPRSRYERFVLDLEIRQARAAGAAVASVAGGFAEADLEVEGLPAAEVLALVSPSRSKPRDSRVEALRSRIREAKSPVFVYEERALPLDAAQAVFSLAAQHPQGRVLALRAPSNLSGLIQVGFNPEPPAADAKALARSLKAALIVGADPARDPVSAKAMASLDFVVAMAPRENRTTDLAHVVFPLALPIEGRGHVVDALGRLKQRFPATSSPLGRENWETLVSLAAALGADWARIDWRALEREAAAAEGAAGKTEAAAWPVAGPDSLALEVEAALREKGI